MKATIIGSIGIFGFILITVSVAQEGSGLDIVELESNTDAVISVDAYEQLKELVLETGPDEVGYRHDQEAGSLEANEVEAIHAFVRFSLSDVPHYSVAESPDLVRPMVKALTRRGPASIYPSKYPKLTLVSEFDMIGIRLNENFRSFEPVKIKEVLLRRGTNMIETVGGQERDCSFTIDARVDGRYIRECP